MAEPTESADLVFLGSRDSTVGLMRLRARTGGIFVLDEVEARETGEERIQVVEGYSYEYQLFDVPPGYRVRPSPVVQPSTLAPELGRLEPGLETGILPLILETLTGDEVARAAIEVRSSKIDYRREYRDMLDSIAERSTGLLLDIRAPAHARLAPGTTPSVTDIHRRFAFLRHLLQNREFENAIARILRAPHRTREREDQARSIHRGIKGSSSLALQISSSERRVAVPKSHHAYHMMKQMSIQYPSLPSHIVVESKVESFDNPENRFVKYAVRDFERMLERIESVLQGRNGDADRRLLRELYPLRSRLGHILERDFFREISDPQTLPLGSPVLQRRAGYRELLQFWLKFNLAAHLNWSGADDVFGAGKRDIATLYEYWLFFELLDLAQVFFQIDPSSSDQLIEWTRDHFDLKLKLGRNLQFRGRFLDGGTPLDVQFSFNRTFSGPAKQSDFSYPHAGSWSRSMRPDFTFTFWPSAFTLDEAERQELVVHVHFDAKYRVDGLTSLFGTDNASELDDEKASQRTNTAAKRADLLKMHAYRDAVRRTAGAYVLYPGSSGADRQWYEFHEILPGLGAFAVRPSSEDSSKAALSQFLKTVAHHVSDETTRRLQTTYHVFRIQEPSGDYRSTMTLPREDALGRSLRGTPYPERPARRLIATSRRRGRPLANPANRRRHRESS